MNFFGERQTKFQNRIKQYLHSIIDDCPFILDYDLKMDTQNTFPHSAGMASSASSMSALALCLCSMEEKLYGSFKDPDKFFAKAAYLARMGSGSATRSIFSPVVCWGKTVEVPESSDMRGVPVNGLPVLFNDYRDAVLIVDPSPKKLESREGHRLMKNHICKENRFLQANQRFSQLLTAMRQEDLNLFCQIVEAEALSLHGLIATSSSPMLLLRPASLAVMEAIVKFRKKVCLPVCFTLDAGPNVHLLYPGKMADIVESFIEKDLCPLLYKRQWIADSNGKRPLAKNMKEKSFCSKILLFGEYSVIQNSMALAIPYPLFEGKLAFHRGIEKNCSRFRIKNLCKASKKNNKR